MRSENPLALHMGKRCTDTGTSTAEETQLANLIEELFLGGFSRREPEVGKGRIISRFLDIIWS